ncbi:T9SS type A sorting domain-containing protein [Microvirga sp. STS02]|uniref:CARDB domain-containing protein n=1 Tax=Hymenobacter negativus TaxID=2795026 RepID=UPI0018DDE34F|nr:MULTISPECIES: CARDB domain-containing protein [Bacteria]MBH8568409.1 T9SS type A sorting domain-containing protein [Hymenobacter negativus]MBR7208144.1 T9SS type A sorting domain-containing protein [Microvirga sp. STS02]
MKQSYDAIFRTPVRWCILVAVLLWSQLANAQTYLLPTSGINTVTTCAGTLYDDGGASGPYSTNALGGTTLVPATAGNKIRLQFSQFNIDPYYDVVRIYDGSSTSAPLIGEYTNYNLPPASVYATNATGSLTVVLQSDYYYSLSGIEAAVSCVTTVPLADLAVQGASVSPLSTVAGNSVSLSCSIYNIGAGVASSSSVGYYFSTDATLDANDVLLGNSTGASLNPGLSSSRYASVTIPATTAPGSYYILFAGDYLSQVSESNENNNVASVNVTVTAPSIDLTILQPSVTPTTTAVGTPISMSCYILNTGNATAASSSVGFYISTNNTLDANDVLLTSQYGGSLTTTYSSSRYGTAAIPTGLTPGTYYILFVADYQGQVAETNETNNVASVAITVAPPGVDLIVQQPSLYYTSTVAGGTVQASASIYNQGNVTATSSTMGFYLSTNTTLDASDVLLSTVTGGSLAANLSSYRSANLTVPVGTAAGSYYVLFVADPTNVVTETNETNNVSSVALTVIAPTIDLSVTYPYVSPTTVAAGGSASASCYLNNLGNATASPANISFYLSTDNVFSTNDVLVGSQTNSSLYGGGYLSIYSTITVPSATTSGTYYLLFVADPANAVTETNENNNVASTTLVVTAPGIDLQMSQVYASPYTIGAGGTLSLSSYIYNTGTVSSPSSTVGYYLSTNATLDASDVLLNTVAGSSLAANASSYRTASATVPVGTAAGYYYVLFVADPANAVTETNETNNVASTSIQVIAPTIDLSVTYPYVTPTSVAAGASVSASCYLNNLGNSAATPANINFYLSTDNVFSANDVLVGSQPNSTLYGGGYLSIYSTITVPATTASGTYYVLFVADPTNAVAETNENNNVASTTLVVTAPGIDLQMSQVYASPYTVGTGATLSLTSYIYNTGSLSSPSSTIGYYLSTNSTLDASDVLLTTVAGGSLSAGLSAYRTASATIPTATAPGYYYVLFVADPANAVTETNENNNVASTTIQVTAPSIDLQITQLYMNLTSVAPGTSVAVTSYIYNAGNTSSPSSNVGYYLSTNSTLDANDVLMSTTTGGQLGAYQSLTSYGNVTIPTGTAAGNYYLLAVADPTNVVTETNENNNVAYYYFTVTGPFTGTIVPFSGTNTVTTCSTTVYDHGGFGNYSDNANGTLTINPGTANSRIQLSFNSFAVESCCDRLMIYDGPDAQSPLLATLTAMPSLPIMATNSTGALTLVFTSDGSVTASGFDAAVTCVTAPTILPDLLLTQIGASPSSVPAGGNLSLSATVANQGGGSAASSAVGYYLSTNQTLDASDVQLGSSAGTSLAATVSANRQLVATVPASTTPGAYYVLFVADPLNVVAEANETNNLASLAVTVTTGLASREQTAGYSVAVAPNPVANGDALRVQMTGVGATCTAAVDLYNALGQRVNSQQLQLGTGRANQAEIPTRGLATGVYVLHLTGTNLNVTRRVVIE